MRLSAVVVLLAAASYAEEADLILKNGRIVTLEKARPIVQALAARDGRILALGSNAQIAKYTAKRVIDLQNATAVPGLIESHGHFMGLGQMKMNLNLMGARNWSDIVAMVGAAAKEAKPGEWVIGRGFHQSKWEKAPSPNVQGFPLNTELSRVSPNNPVLLTHASGHAAIANDAALKLAGIDGSTKNPTGGEILRDTSGRATGVLNETAQGLVGRAYSDYQKKRPLAERVAEARRQVSLAAQESLSKGITTFVDAGSGTDVVDLLKTMAGEKSLPLRLWVMLRIPSSELPKAPAYRTIGYGDGFLTVRAFKRQIDGALGSRGAWLLDPYADLPSSAGLNTEDPQDIRKTAEFAIQNGFQLCVHAIGDRGNREVLDIYEQAFRAHPDKNDLRWRMEHAQHLSAADIPRFAKLGVIASMQPIHCTSDAPYVLARLGPKRAEEGAYVWRKLIDSGATVATGTDVPVEDVDPIANFYAAVTRRLKDGSTFYPSQRMTREEVLRSYTINGAYAAFEEKDKGSLAVGKLADVTVLSQDLLRVAEDKLLGTQVLYTIVGGRVAYQQKESGAGTPSNKR